MRGLALGATVVALAVAGCGGDEPAPFEERATSTTTSAPSVAAGEPSADDILTSLTARQQKALAALVAAQVALRERGDAVASTGTDADKLVRRVQAGFQPPSGSTPEVRRLTEALTAFSGALGAIATQEDMLPALSTQLGLRYKQLVTSKPAVAAHVLEAKQQVDATRGAIAGLRDRVDDAAAEAKRQLSELTLDADALADAVTSGSQSATEALNGVSLAVELGVRALAGSRSLP